VGEVGEDKNERGLFFSGKSGRGGGCLGRVEVGAQDAGDLARLEETEYGIDVRLHEPGPGKRN
jgi:hypothetical protein